VRSRIPPRLARRIDRLARAGHRFHRFAHHPLCGRYEGEVVRVGRRGRVCLGCLTAGTGLAAGAALGLAVALPVAVPALAGGLGVGLAGASLWAPRRARRRRWMKLLTRALPGLALALCTGAGIRLAATGALLPGLLLALGGGAVIAGVVLAYRRRTPDRTPCATCPEANRPGPCSGMLPIVRRERAIQRLVGRWLDDAGV
jgi:hypothetical protein